MSCLYRFAIDLFVYTEYILHFYSNFIEILTETDENKIKKLLASFVYAY